MSASPDSLPTPAPETVRRIAKEAALYGYPVVEMYKTLYAQAVDRDDPNFKAPFNRIGNVAKFFTPADNAFITPNSDTPYSFLWMDLRAQPLVLTLPPVEPDRYVSVQLIDLYTHNAAYLGTRSTGHGGGRFLVAGPDWNGQAPAGIDRVVRLETRIAYALYRTQVFDEADLQTVCRIQAGYRVQTLSEYAGAAASAAPSAAPIEWPRPAPDVTNTPALFRFLSFMLQFAPPHPSETELLQRLAQIGIQPGGTFDEQRLDAAMAAAMAEGIADARRDYMLFAKAELATRRLSSADLFGSREHLRNNYLLRYAGAALGIFGNSAEEAIYPGYYADATGQPLDAAARRYELRMEAGQLPPADAFWSITMYDGRTKLLVDNPLHRYLVNSRMLDSLQRDASGAITLHVQHAHPGDARESNWLPAPNGPFYAVLRIYLPRPEAISGAWRQPPLTVVS